MLVSVKQMLTSAIIPVVQLKVGCFLGNECNASKWQCKCGQFHSGFRMYFLLAKWPMEGGKRS